MTLRLLNHASSCLGVARISPAADVVIEVHKVQQGHAEYNRYRRPKRPTEKVVVKKETLQGFRSPLFLLHHHIRMVTSRIPIFHQPILSLPLL